MLDTSLRTVWTIQEPDSAVMTGYEDSDIPTLIQRLLVLRGITDTASTEAYFNPKLSNLGDPFSLPDMAEAVSRLFQAIENKEQVILYGDYDVDGVTSLALMNLTLQAYGLKPHCFLPLRMEEGYGLSIDALKRSFDLYGKPHLLIAMDCGTGSVAEAAWLKEMGVDTMIIDHHEPGPVRPECTALINPKLTGIQTYFCTVGLTFKLAHALLKTQRLAHFDLRHHLDLVALGTVADLVPLQDENRILVHRGLERLTNCSRPGICALKNISGMDGDVQTQHIGFRLGPRLNAAGRLDTAHIALDLLLCTDERDARRGADQLDASNRERQEVEAQAQKEAEAMLLADPDLSSHSCLVLGSRAWHQGVVGIVASRLMRDHHRPVLVIAFDENGHGKGSGRSVPGISLVDALQACREIIVKGGGHAMAAGVSILEANLSAFRQAMSDAVTSQIQNDELIPKIHVDAEVRLEEITPAFLAQYSRMEPFGMGNPEPVFLARNVSPVLPGNVIKEKHWKIQLRQENTTKAAMWFNAEWSTPPKAPWDVIFKLQRQVWRGNETWQLIINAVRSADGHEIARSHM